MRSFSIRAVCSLGACTLIPGLVKNSCRSSPWGCTAVSPSQLDALHSFLPESNSGSGVRWGASASPREKVSGKRHRDSGCVISNSACLCTPSMNSPNPHTPFTSIWSVHRYACAGFRDCWLSPLNACSGCNAKCEMCCYMNAVWCLPMSLSLYMLEDPPKTKAHYGMYAIWLDSSNFSSQVPKPWHRPSSDCILCHRAGREKLMCSDDQWGVSGPRLGECRAMVRAQSVGTGEPQETWRLGSSGHMRDSLPSKPPVAPVSWVNPPSSTPMWVRGAGQS